ncbi:sulfotransferase family 2 domain-containing protein [Hyphomicrobium facile]|uniref:Sulfotransferase family protein n=1 Tax=Hyphomicrobium facile TaxID=51670 RepID=A0A1I7NVV5_9HYPH|nr:sulfotransferase family 2 domain-containing protein [Hyphomicrobium facile]SFV38806.1 Sulfotransferase family protein [Hyphomicrobium facile]
MIVSHARRFIFVKTSKTAGTSIEISLSELCGADDIIAPARESKERKYPAYRARNLAIPLYRAAYVSLPIPPLSPVSKHFRFRKAFYEHMPAVRVRRALPKSVWDSYFKFTIVRNPYDRALSQYFWNNRKTSTHTKETINKYLLEKSTPSLLTNWFMYTSGGDVLVDHFIRYEELESGFQSTLSRLGIDQPLTLPNAKGGVRPNEIHYRDVITPAARQHIERFARPELDLFDYAW